MKPKTTKKFLTFILLLSGMFFSFVADAQFLHCDCVPGNPVGFCYVNGQGQTKCYTKKIKGGWLKGNQIIESAPLAVSPNPVSNSATISFFLERSQKVSLKIFDITGRLVSTPVDKIFKEGENKLMWNTEKMNGEIYFLQLQSEENRETVKWLVTK